MCQTTIFIRLILPALRLILVATIYLGNLHGLMVTEVEVDTQSCCCLSTTGLFGVYPP